MANLAHKCKLENQNGNMQTILFCPLFLCKRPSFINQQFGKAILVESVSVVHTTAALKIV